jgi:hypothetical protein
MPIKVTDYSWSETDDTVFITVPLKVRDCGVPRAWRNANCKCNSLSAVLRLLFSFLATTH